MGIEHDIRRLMAARAAREQHTARLMARITLDPVTRAARIGSIFATRDDSTRRRARILALLDLAVARASFSHLA